MKKGFLVVGFGAADFWLLAAGFWKIERDEDKGILMIGV